MRPRRGGLSRLSFLLPAALVAALLVACGGGGGGTASSPGSGGTTGLVPAAPTPGETLVADATTLRPLQAGAEWQYRGTRTSGGTQTPYAASVVQADGGGGRIQETSRGGSIGTGDDVVVLAAEGGSIVMREDGAFLGLPAGEQLTTVELRSPVRANDQYTLIDRAGIPAGDLDGDARADTYDFAVWSRVVGWEDVALPALGTTLRAVRVESTALVRVRLASGAAAPAPQPLVRTVWYAPGVGPVRRVENDGVNSTLFDDRLVSWDGGADGLGISNPVVLQHGLAGASDPWLREAWAAAAVDHGNGALVVAPSVRSGDSRRLTVVALDRRGRLQGAAELPDAVSAAGATYIRPSLVSLGAQAALLVPEPRGSGSRFDLRLTRLGADGRPVGATAPLLDIDSAGHLMAVGGDAGVIWVMALTRRNPFSDEALDLRLLAFDGQGQPLAPPLVLDTGDLQGNAVWLGNVSVQGSRVLATWFRRDGSTRAQRLALVDSPGSPPLLADLARDTNPGAAAFATTAWPVLGSEVAAVWWRQPLLGMDISGPGPGTFGPRGVTLSEALVPTRSVSGPIDDERLPAAWDNAAPEPLFLARGSSIVVAGVDTSTQPSVALLTQIAPDADALATAAGRAGAQRVSADPVGLGRIDRATHLVAVEGRVIIVGHDGSRVVTASAALR
jgi:hypothetical protein